MVYHSVVLNVNSNSSDCVVDIPQKDRNSHQLLIKLVHCGKFYNVSGYDPEITFYDSTTGTVVVSSAVTVLNDYRGYLSYVVGPRLVENSGRYTVTLRLKKGTSVKLSCNFIVNIVNSPQDCDCDCDCHGDMEVTITKEFYEKLRRHLDNRLIHNDESDRSVLDFLSDNLDTFVTTSSLNNIFEIIKFSQEFKDIVTEVVNEIVDSGSVVDEVVSKVVEVIGSDIKRLEDDLSNNSVKLESLTKTVSEFDSRILSTESAVEQMSTEVSEMKVVVDGVEEYDQRISSVENSVTDLSASDRSQNDRIKALEDSGSGTSDPNWTDL